MSVLRMKIELEDLITITDLTEIFVVHEMTIHRWKQSKNLGVCIVDIPSRDRPVLRYTLKGVLEWAYENDIPVPGLTFWEDRRAKKKGRQA